MTFNFYQEPEENKELGMKLGRVRLSRKRLGDIDEFNCIAKRDGSLPLRATMLNPLLHKRFLRVGLLALVVAMSYWICSSSAKTAIRGLPPVERPPMFVLQVGIGKYKNAPTWAELRGAVTDVVEMRKVLEERYQVPKENIVTLTDQDGTKQIIFEKFRSHLIANAKKQFEKTHDRKDGAVALFEFSGHGSQVPDVDGDEKDDGKDETLVTVDSQDLPGKNFDITDDEIYALTSELRVYTDNIVYIFDSCHSGSGTRDSQDVRRLPERKTIPVVVDRVGAGATRSGVTKPEDSTASPILPPGDDYIVITAARSRELASQKNCFEECGNARTPVVYGNLTFYLIDELKNARSDTSYRELMENVTRRVVAEKPTQTPQIEGDKARFVFGSLGSSEDNFVRIVEAETKKANGTRTVKIRAGAMQGVTPGAIVSFYDKAVTRFDGTEKISAGTVSEITPTESTVELIGAKREITIEDKAVVVGPDLGSLRLKVDLDVDAGKFNADEKKTIALTRSYLTPETPTEKREVELVTTRTGQIARWDVAILKDKFSSVLSKIEGVSIADFSCEVPGSDETPPAGVGAADREVLYLAGRDFVPLYGFCLEPATANEAQRTAAARRLEKALVHLAGLKTVNSIANKRSGLNRAVIVTPVRLGGPFTCQNSTLRPTSLKPSIADAKTGAHRFASHEPVWFEVANNSTRSLYLALLNMAPDGAVNLFAPRGKRAEEAGGLIIPAGGKRIIPGDDCRVENGDIIEAGALRASRVSGVDRFKFIVSVAPITYDDFSYLEMPSLRSRNSRGSLAVVTDWTTIETILQINDTGR